MRLPSGQFLISLALIPTVSHTIALLLSLALLPTVSHSVALEQLLEKITQTAAPRRKCQHEAECKQTHKNRESKKIYTQGRIHNHLRRFLQVTTGTEGTSVKVVVPPPEPKVVAPPVASVSVIRLDPQSYFIASSKRTDDMKNRKMLKFELRNKYHVSQYQVKKTILYVYLQKRRRYKYPTRVSVRVSNVTRFGVKDRVITRKRLRFTTDMWYQINMPLVVGQMMTATPSMPLVLHIRGKCMRRRGPKLIRVAPRRHARHIQQDEEKTPFIMFKMDHKSMVSTSSRHRRSDSDIGSYTRFKREMSTPYKGTQNAGTSYYKYMYKNPSNVSIPKPSIVIPGKLLQREITTNDTYKHDMVPHVRSKHNYMTSRRLNNKQGITSFYNPLKQNAMLSHKFTKNSVISHKFPKNMTTSRIHTSQNVMTSVNVSKNYNMTSHIQPQNTMTSVHISTNSMSSPDILRRKLTSHIRPLMTNRPKREVMTAINCAPNSCCEYLYYVNLTAQSFGASVIAPDGFVQTRCRGSCAGSRPANVSADGGWRCRPVRRDPLRIAYFDDNNNLAEMVMHRYLIRGCECKARSARRERARVLALQSVASPAASVPMGGATGGEASAAASASG